LADTKPIVELVAKELDILKANRLASQMLSKNVVLYQEGNSHD
jgi:hypothetical protein